MNAVLKRAGQGCREAAQVCFSRAVASGTENRAVVTFGCTHAARAAEQLPLVRPGKREPGMGDGRQDAESFGVTGSSLDFEDLEGRMPSFGHESGFGAGAFGLDPLFDPRRVDSWDFGGGVTSPCARGRPV